MSSLYRKIVSRLKSGSSSVSNSACGRALMRTTSDVWWWIKEIVFWSIVAAGTILFVTMIVVAASELRLYK